MAEHETALLGLIALLQIKHLFADYFLQTPMMLSGRGTYLHLGRALHAGVHALGSIIVFVIFGAPVSFILPVVLIEWFVHFNIDYGKAKWSEIHNQTPDQAGFWRANGTDQALHQLTYVAMAWAWLVLVAT
ncbi:MAG: DUF3307 domain-containing protein [Rhodobacteraceae bacterium]|nr:DUF3307 domain-containing protein [Paracoccaceae bacterium]